MRHDREEQSNTTKSKSTKSKTNSRTDIKDELGNVKQRRPTLLYNRGGGLTHEITKKFDEYAEHIQRTTTNDVFDITLIPGSSNGGGSLLACDTIAMTLRTGNKMTVCCILVYTTAAPLAPRTYELRNDYYGIDEDIELPVVPSEIFDEVFKEYVGEVIQNKQTSGDIELTFTSPKILYKNWEIHQAEDVFTEVVNSLGLTHAVMTTRDMSDQSINDIADEDYMLDINVSNVDSSRKVYDESGLVIMPTLEANVSYCKRRRRNKQSRTYNNPTDVTQLMKVYYRASFVYGAGEVDYVNGDGRYGDAIATERQCFIPLLTLEQYEDPKPTLGRQLLALMASIKVLNSDRWATIVERPEVLSYLNIRCNLEGEKNPAPLDKDLVADNINKAIDDMIYPQPLLGMISRKGTSQAHLFETWINDPDAVVEAGDHLSDGAFSEELEDGTFDPPVYEARLAGVYNINNERRTLAEIDIVQLLTQHPDKADLHQLWIESQSASSFKESIALKMYVLNKCVVDYEILDIHNIIYIPESVIDALSAVLDDSDIKVVTNTWRAKRSNDNWTPHRALSRMRKRDSGRGSRRRRGRGHRR